VRQILFSILLIGDIEFTQHSQGDGVVVSNIRLIDTSKFQMESYSNSQIWSVHCGISTIYQVSELLDLQPELLHDALISDLQFTRGEEIRRERNMIQACDVRDAFAKALYGRLFSWIVNHINHHIQPVDGM
jgi:myosin-3